MSRMILLTEGMSNPAEAKTATGLLRYRGEEVAAVYDSACAGRTAGEVLGVGGAIPFVDSLDGLEADTLVMGIATAGGELPGSWRAIITDALRGGMKILNGLPRIEPVLRHHVVAEMPLAHVGVVVLVRDHVSNRRDIAAEGDVVAL